MLHAIGVKQFFIFARSGHTQVHQLQHCLKIFYVAGACDIVLNTAHAHLHGRDLTAHDLLDLCRVILPEAHRHSCGYGILRIALIRNAIVACAAFLYAAECDFIALEFCWLDGHLHAIAELVRSRAKAFFSHLRYNLARLRYGGKQ